MHDFRWLISGQDTRTTQKSVISVCYSTCSAGSLHNYIVFCNHIAIDAGRLAYVLITLV